MSVINRSKRSTMGRCSSLTAAIHVRTAAAPPGLAAAGLEVVAAGLRAGVLATAEGIPLPMATAVSTLPRRWPLLGPGMLLVQVLVMLGLVLPGLQPFRIGGPGQAQDLRQGIAQQSHRR